MNKVRTLSLLCLAAAGFAAAPAFACFTVYDRSNQVVYFGPSPPVDMRPQLHDTVPYAFPGGHMVFGLNMDCYPIVDLRPIGVAYNPRGGVQVTVISQPRGARAARRDRE